jgi:putative restriction endonuclease
METVSTASRLSNYPFEVQSELRDAANEHGYRIGPEQAAGWLFFRSATAPGEIAVAATNAGMAGPFFLSVAHPGAAREMKAATASPSAKGHAGAFMFPTRDALFAGVSAVYRLSMSLPTLPYEDYLREIAHLGNTEAERAQKVRIGQNRFREALFGYWNGACPLTGITNVELLRASHIIPWAKCDSDLERLNVHNGLLLSSLWDAAFDAGLVTFDDQGRVIVSPNMSEPAVSALGIELAPSLHVTDEHRTRLAWHRSNRWQGG